MKSRSDSARLYCFALLFLVLSAICSLQRFGQRENETAPVLSDSDLYIDMARVFVGDAPAFNADYVKAGPHHYNRPLLSFLAGHLAKYVLQNHLRAAFSLINIFSITVLAVLLLQSIRQSYPAWRLYWLPPVLLLCGFPQMNWGYHILTDTLGLATAFALGCYATWLINKSDGSAPWDWRRLSLHLVALWTISAAAFLARETAWIAVVATIFLIYVRRGRGSSCLVRYGLILAVILLGKMPHSWYGIHFHVTGVPIRPVLSNLLNWRYVLDLSVKTFVCFNLAWLVAGVTLLKRDRAPLPDWVKSWTLATVLYMGAGYAANTIEVLGYPLRMSYSLFPLVFLAVEEFFERSSLPAKRLSAGIAFCLLQYSINFVGVRLDAGQGKITVLDLWNLLKPHLAP